MVLQLLNIGLYTPPLEIQSRRIGFNNRKRGVGFDELTVGFGIGCLVLIGEVVVVLRSSAVRFRI